LQIPIYLGAGILFQIPNLEFGINLGTGVGVLLEEIPDLQFVLNVGACLKFWRNFQIWKFRQILATSGVGEVLKQIADLEFVSNVGVAELLQQIADLQFVVNLGDFSSASGLKPRVWLKTVVILPHFSTVPTSPRSTPRGRLGGI